MLRRIISGFGANAFGQAINILIQIFSLPLFLLRWDTATYGSWLMVSAVPAYLSMADVGMVQAAANKMTMAMGRSDAAEANIIFQSTQLVVVVICAVLCILLTPLALLAPLPDFITNDQRTALVVLFNGVLITLFSGLADAVFRATGRFPIGTVLGNLVRLGEWGGMIAGLFLFGTFAGVALCGVLVRVCGTCLGVLLAQKGGHGLHWGISQASKHEILTMVRPAASFMAFPLANALSFQGVTLLAGALTGTATVTLFNAYRTIARVAFQLTVMFGHALWPEFARLYGQGGPGAVESLFRRSALLGAIQAIGLSFTLYFVSPWLLQIWTHGRIEFVPSLMALLLAYAAVSGIWHVPAVLLLATNQHVGLAGWSLASGGLSVTLAWLFGREWQIEGVAAAMLVSECFIGAVSVYLSYRSFARVRSAKEYPL